MTETEKEEIRESYSSGFFALNNVQIEMLIEQREAQEKVHKTEMWNWLVMSLLFWPVFIGIWATTLFAWGPLISLAIGWLPAFIGGGIVYLIFRTEYEK